MSPEVKSDLASDEDRQLVDQFIEAWNAQDIPAILGMLSRNAIYYDAFWNETCKKDNLGEYLDGSFDEERYFYRLNGEIYRVGDNIAFQYQALKRPVSGSDDIEFIGSEVLTITDGKISRVADYYSDTDPESLVWVAQLHDQEITKYARSGLRAEKKAQLRSRLNDLMSRDQVYRAPDLSLARLAERLNCSVNHLSQLINSEFGSNFSNYLNRYRIELASEYLLSEVEGKHHILNVADRVGFASVSAFYAAFKKHCGMTPRQFQKMKRN